MAKKIYISGKILLVTDTATGALEFDVPKNDFYYDWRALEDKNIIRLIDANTSNYQNAQYYEVPISNAVDESLTPFTKESFKTFARGTLKQLDTGTLIAGKVTAYADLPSPAVDYQGQFWMVEANSGGLLSAFGLYKYPKGVYSPNASNVWEITPFSVKYSEDSLTLVNITNWAEYINLSADINNGDLIQYNNVQYQNKTGVQTSNSPDIDISNWEIAGQARVVYFDVYNGTGQTITKGTIVAPDPTTTITTADAYFKDKSQLVGVVFADIPSMGSGYIVKSGRLSGVNTTGFIPGQSLYLGTNGQFATTPPDDGGYDVIIGVVDVVDAINGVITVDIRSSYTTVEVTDTNGFPRDQKANTTLSADNGTRTFTITPSGAGFHFYELGKKYEKTGAQSVIWSDDEGEHWFYFNAGVLTHVFNPTSTQKQDVILKHTFVAAICWDATNKAVVVDIHDERHGIGMAPETHLYNHLVNRAKYVSGYGLNNLLVDQDGSLNTHAQFGVDAGKYRDEDIEHNFTGVAVGGTIPVLYNIGAAQNLRTGSQNGFSFLNAPSGRVYYNENNGGTWQLTEATDNYYVLYHLFGYNGQTVNLISIMGQSQYATDSEAKANANKEITNITTSLALAETIPVATFILQTSNSFTNSVKARLISVKNGLQYLDYRGVQNKTYLDEIITFDPSRVDVFSPSDLPAPIAGVRTLVDNTDYVVHGTINIGTDRIVTAENSKLVGENVNIDKIIYTGTGNFITVSNQSFTARTIQLISPNGTTISATDSTLTKSLYLVEIVIAQTQSIGTFTGFGSILWNLMQIVYFNQGATFTGNCATIAMNSINVPMVRLSGTTGLTLLTFTSTFTTSTACVFLNSSFKTYRAADRIFNIDTTAVMPLANISNNTFDLFAGSQVFENATPNNRLGFVVSGNLGLDDWLTIGSCTLTGGTSQIATTQNQWYLPADATTVRVSSRIDSPSTARLRYNGIRGTRGDVICAVTCEKVTGGSVTFQGAIFKNGALISHSIMGATVSGSGIRTAFPILVSIDMTTNDYFEFMIRNISNNDNIIVTNLQMQLRG